MSFLTIRHFNDLGESGLDILLYFYLRVPDYATELREREVILLRILRLAKESNVEFAHPTRTLQIDGAPDRQTGYKEPVTPEDRS